MPMKLKSTSCMKNMQSNDKRDDKTTAKEISSIYTIRI